ncbi:transmembrane protein 272-like [Ostrea edulis]|uniref:transmembrane protein 272-like n=1 Tax=Ostrea edulis TaxID=37623 RepID=UPI0024AEB42B|nr:transmembrane protein 272-like [Ostrea edulis]
MANIQIYPTDSANPTESVMDPPVVFTANPTESVMDPPTVYTANEVAKNDPPPSYDSLFGKIKQAEAESKGNVDFGKKCCAICTGSTLFTIFVSLFLGVPVSMIVIGSIYMYDCRAERMIPIFLVVHGVFLCIDIFYGLRKKCLKEGKEKDKKTKKEKSKAKKADDCLQTLLNFFLFIWFICGNIFTFNLEWVSSPVIAPNYCHPTLYYFTYWIIMSVYILFCAILAVVVFIFWFTIISAAGSRKRKGRIITMK